VQIAHEKGRQFAQRSISAKHQVFKREYFSYIARHLMKKVVPLFTFLLRVMQNHGKLISLLLDVGQKHFTMEYFPYARIKRL